MIVLFSSVSRQQAPSDSGWREVSGGGGVVQFNSEGFLGDCGNCDNGQEVSGLKVGVRRDWLGFGMGGGWFPLITGGFSLEVQGSSWNLTGLHL